MLNSHLFGVKYGVCLNMSEHVWTYCTPLHPTCIIFTNQLNGHLQGYRPFSNTSTIHLFNPQYRITQSIICTWISMCPFFWMVASTFLLSDVCHLSTIQGLNHHWLVQTNSSLNIFKLPSLQESVWRKTGRKHRYVANLLSIVSSFVSHWQCISSRSYCHCYLPTFAYLMTVRLIRLNP